MQIYPPGNSPRTIRLDLMRSMRPHEIEIAVASAAELDELLATRRPRTGSALGRLAGP